MEYGQELDKLDKIKSDVLKLQETINSFQGDEDVLSRVEEKIDVLAQTDYSELFNFSMENIKSDISENFDSVQTSLVNISEKLRSNSNLFDTSLEDLTLIKENFQGINDKLSKIIHLTQTNIGENEELNNRFESNLTRFNSGFQSLYEQFTKFDSVFQKNIQLFDTRFKDIYDQFSTIDIRNDIDQIKLYVQSFSNKLTGVSEIIDGLKEKNFSVNLDKIDNLEENIIGLSEIPDKIDILGKKITEICEIKTKINTLENIKSDISENFESVQSKIDFLNRNVCSLLDKFDNDTFEIRMSNEKIVEESLVVKKEILNLSGKVSDEFSSFAAPLASILEIAGGLNETLHSFKDGLLGSPDELNTLKDNILEVSSKLNKLILNEKENTDSIKGDLSQNNKNLIKKLSEEFEVISKKIADVSEISSNTLTASETMKDVIVCIAEWFDKAGKLIEENNENIKKNSINKINDLLIKTETNINDHVKKISEKMNRLEIRLESIEGKIERVQDQYSNREILLLLSDVLEKVEISNERSKVNELILKRLERIEPKTNNTDENKELKSRKRNPEE